MIIDSLNYNGMCSCGKEHTMQTELSVVERGCLKKIDFYLEKYGISGTRVAVYDENTYKATADRHPSCELEVILDPRGLHANEHGVDAFMKKLDEYGGKVGVLLAIGSGTIHDITRYCAYKLGVDFVSCPTAASVDGFCSSVAAMTWHGFKKTLTAVAPRLVLADIDVIMNAPIELARSGFGDLIGKYVSLSDWRISHVLTGEYYCERIADMTMQATREALDSAEGIIRHDEAAYEKLTYGLLLSGLAMQMIGNSRPASGAEHHISHLIEIEPEQLGAHSDALHGEKVGVGTLLVIEEYKRLAERKDIAFSDYKQLPECEMCEFFGKDLYDEIAKENENNVAVGVSAEMLRRGWDKVCEIIREIPETERLKSVYAHIGVKLTLADIDIPEDVATALLKYSPLVRNRLTLMRLAGCFG